MQRVKGDRDIGDDEENTVKQSQNQKHAFLSDFLEIQIPDRDDAPINHNIGTPACCLLMKENLKFINIFHKLSFISKASTTVKPYVNDGSISRQSRYISCKYIKTIYMSINNIYIYSKLKIEKKRAKDGDTVIILARLAVPCASANHTVVCRTFRPRRTSKNMQKYEKLEKIGEGKSTSSQTPLVPVLLLYSTLNFM